jgi:hypothetical protein
MGEGRDLQCLFALKVGWLLKGKRDNWWKKVRVRNHIHLPNFIFVVYSYIVDNLWINKKQANRNPLRKQTNTPIRLFIFHENFHIVLTRDWSHKTLNTEQHDVSVIPYYTDQHETPPLNPSSRSHENRKILYTHSSYLELALSHEMASFLWKEHNN